MKRMLLSAAALLVFAACGGTSIGRPCTTGEDCDSGQSCFTDLPGGYCSKGCSVEGSGKECPGGSVCAMNGGRLLCSLTCEAQNDCRDGYQCNGVSGTTDKVCRP